ncbi:MAG: beta-N-acetylhexosaminidase [Opitutales bacterium]
MQFTNPPRFEHRGLMLDISRNRVPSMDCLRDLIDALAKLNYNQLQLYTEHTFAYEQHEAVWHAASPMTAKEIREIDAYCADRGIELVPNQNSFGHMERWLCHDDYRPLAESPDGFEHPIAGWRASGSTLYPDSKSADFIDSLYRELLPNFRSSQLHIGGDEPWELGKGRSRERVEREGKHRVYLDFIKELCERCKKHGRVPQIWADIVMERPDLVGELPAEVIPVIWGYEADSPFSEQCAIARDAGFGGRFYVAPGAGNWNSFSGRLDIARTNIELAAEQGQAHGASGLLLTAWGDNGHHQPWPTLYPALILAAAAAHNTAISDTALAATIDEVFYPQQPRGHGERLCKLGQIDSMLPQPGPPNSFLHSVFFANEKQLVALKALTNESALEACLEALDGLTGEPIDPEIRLGIELNRFALERCLGLAHSKTRKELADIFASKWRRRSREGGLTESRAKML